jgi:hypothetical protein
LVGRGTAAATAEARDRSPMAREVPMSSMPNGEETS